MGKIQDLYAEKEKLAKRYSEITEEIEAECSKISTEEYAGKYVKIEYGYPRGTRYMHVTETSDEAVQTSFSSVNPLYNNVRYNWIKGYAFSNGITGDPSSFSFDFSYQMVSITSLKEMPTVITREEFYEELEKRFSEIRKVLN